MEEAKGRKALLKLREDGQSNPIPVTLESFEAGGIWVKGDATAMREFIGDEPMVRDQSLGLRQSPVIFLPLSRIEWLLANDTDTP